MSWTALRKTWGNRWPKLDAARRFAYKVYARGDCWEWRGVRSHRYEEYGSFFADGAYFGAHRYSYTLAKGTIAPGYEIDHLCRHPWCVRPSHLEAVQQGVNQTRAARFRKLKTHCPRGHRYDSAKIVHRTGRKAFRQVICLTCRRDEQRLYRQKRRA